MSKKIYVCIDKDIIDECWRDDDDLSCFLYVCDDLNEASEYAEANDSVVCERITYSFGGTPEVKYVERDPNPEDNPMVTRFGGCDDDWNKYLKLRKGDKVRFKKTAFEYEGHENDIYTMTSDGVFSMCGSLCGMFDGLSGAYCISVFDVVECLTDNNK